MKKVLITGGATGIGKACAKKFLKKEYEVFVTYNETPCDLQGVNAVKCNLKNSDDIKSLFETVGTVDVLVNNAGVSLVKMINDTTEEDYDLVTSVNERAVYFCSKHAALGMIKSQSGAIINISSMWGQCGASCETLYSMTKAGVIGFTKALAQELAPSGITVNCVCPGIIDTRMNAQFNKAELEEEVPLGRLGTPEEVADAVLFFAENRYTTGQVLGVNGGIV
ncbi:MAG: SDR family oxidoreductase [Ruminococcaceae bacterium]|nr:SDR family oxidoreductase [Oscillospiraceae bacterium]